MAQRINAVNHVEAFEPVRRLSHGRALGLEPKVGSVVAVELLPYSEHADEIAWALAARADPVGGPRLLLLPKNTVDPLKLLSQRTPDRAALSVVHHADGDYAFR